MEALLGLLFIGPARTVFDFSLSYLPPYKLLNPKFALCTTLLSTLGPDTGTW